MRDSKFRSSPAVRVVDSQREPLPTGLGDRSEERLVQLAVDSRVQENRARALTLLAMAEFHARVHRVGGDPSPIDPSQFVLTPLQSVKLEFAPALVVSEMTIEMWLDSCNQLRMLLPAYWEQCLAGRLDLSRAMVVLEQVAFLANNEDTVAYAGLMEAYLARYDDPHSALVPIDRSQLQRAARYRRMKFEQAGPDATFHAAFAKRRVSLRLGDDGMGSLTLSGMVTETMTADYRLTLIAKRLRADPCEARTLEQLRADVALDLLLGRLVVSGDLSGLDTDETDETDDPLDGHEAEESSQPTIVHRSVGAYARPIINVTVPITSLLGLDDGPGVLSGGHPIPAELARIIALDKTATWYRMLTDGGGRFVELSTDAYEPTRPIWRTVVARDQRCLWPTCSRPAVAVELDHRIPFPRGATSTDNLQPLCKAHHKAKHSRGFQVRTVSDAELCHSGSGGSDGSGRVRADRYAWTTRVGSRFVSGPAEQPESQWPNPDLVETCLQ